MTASWLSLLALAVSPLGAPPDGPAPAPERDATRPAEASPAVDEQDAVPGAEVKLEIKGENGKVAKYTALVETLDERWTFQFDGGGFSHEINFQLAADAEAKIFHARTSYARGDGVMVPEFEHDCRYGKREVVETDGGLVFAFTMKPVLVKAKNKPRDEGDRIEPPKVDDDDPLGGL
jgi:hypothetical protein